MEKGGDMKALLVALLVLVAPVASAFTVVNNSGRSLWFAMTGWVYGHTSPDFVEDHFHTSGWHRIDPGATATFGTGDGATVRVRITYDNIDGGLVVPSSNPHQYTQLVHRGAFEYRSYLHGGFSNIYIDGRYVPGYQRADLDRLGFMLRSGFFELPSNLTYTVN